MQTQARSGSAFELARAVWRRRKWLAVVVFAMVISAVVSVVLALPDLYQATATVLVKQEQVPESFIRSSVTGELETRLRASSEQILSRSRLQELISRFDLYPELRKRGSGEAAIKRMRRDIQLDLKEVPQRWGPGATIAFTLSYQGWDPQTAAEVANTLASLYVQENAKMREHQAAETTRSLRVQLEEVRERLIEQEQRIAEFKSQYMGELPEQLDANLAALERLNTQLSMNNANQIRTMGRQETLAKQLAEADRLTGLKRELAELRSRVTDRHPDVVRLKAEIVVLQSQHEEAGAGPASLPRTLKENLRRAEADLKALEAEEARLQSAIDAYQRRIENTAKREQQLQQPSREYEQMRELYASLQKRYEEAQLAEMLERQQGGQFRILDRALAPNAPTDPDRMRLMVMALILSFGMAAGAVVLAEQVDRSFHTVDDVRAFTKVPVWVSIPRIVTRADIWRRRLRFCAASLLVTLGLVVIVQLSYSWGHGNEQLVWMLVQRGS